MAYWCNSVPAQISQQKVIDTIDAAKDVDGLNPANAGRLVSGLDALTPCTPLGSVILAKETLGDLTGKHAVVIGRSNLVGKPVAQLLPMKTAPSPWPIRARLICQRSAAKPIFWSPRSVSLKWSRAIGSNRRLCH